MSLEQKIQTGERSLLKRFLHSAKSKLFNSALGLAMLGTLACDGHKRKITPPPANNAPVITTTAPTSGLEGSAYAYDVDATDAESDPITYSLDSAPGWASINTGTGLISGTPNDSGANRTDPFTVRATDSKGAYSTQNFGVNVTNTGTVSGTAQVKDIDANGLASKTVHLWNTTYPKGRFTGLTNGSGDFTIVDTNIPALSGIPNGSYNLEVEDGFTGIFKFLQPSYATSGNSHNVTNLLPMILMHSIASTNTAYQDSLGNASFLAKLKYDMALRLSDPPGTSGPHPTTTWPSPPINVFYNIAAAPSTDNEDASGNPTPNSVPDVVDRARRGVAEWTTQTGISNLSTEVTTTPSQGIRFLWTALNSNTNVDWTNADGTYGRITINIATSQPLNAIFVDEKHELGHGLGNTVHSPDNLYIMYTGAGQPSNVHADEGRVAKYNIKLPHRINMDLYVDQ